MCTYTSRQKGFTLVDVSSYNAEVLAAQLRQRWPERGAQRAMAAALDIHPSTIGKWFNGDTMPEPSKWSVIEDYCDWDRGFIRALVSADGDDLLVRLNDLSRRVEELEPMSSLLAELTRRVASLEGGRGASRTPRPRPRVG